MRKLSDLFNSLGSKTSSTPFANGAASETVTAEMIHEEFYHACDSIEEELRVGQSTLQKAVRLRKIGFASMPEIKSGAELERKAQIADVISKYAVSHPNNKIIPGAEAWRICEKYNLAFRPASDYTGEIPEKNIVDIENFKAPGGLVGVQTTYTGFDGQKYPQFGFNAPENYSPNTDEVICAPQTKLQICAPVKDIKLQPYERINEQGQIVPKDPIVLFPVEFNCYLIVTAWGEEAKEVNEKLN